MCACLCVLACVCVGVCVCVHAFVSCVSACCMCCGRAHNSTPSAPARIWSDVGPPPHSSQCPQVRSIYEVNVFGLLSVTRAFLPLLRAHGPGARIVNIGSAAGLYSPPVHSVYSSSSVLPLSSLPRARDVA